MDTPESMKSELSAWNNGKGISLEDWIGCIGNSKLAVGYLTIFWPKFLKFEDYILREGFSENSLRGFEKQCNGDRRAIEAVMNHLHISDIHYGCEDFTLDKILILGSVLKEIYEVKLKQEFPDRSFEVSFLQPEDPENIDDFEISFWQTNSS